MNTTNKKKNIHLLINSSAEKTSIIEQALADHGLRTRIRRVNTREALQQALDSCHWHLILSDYQQETLDVLQLNAVLVERGLELPIVVIVEPGREDVAVRCLEAGLCQFIQCDDQQLQRLPLLMNALISQSEEDSRRSHMEQVLRASEERYLDVFDNTSDLIQCLAPDGSFLYTNATWRRVMGYSEEEVFSLNLLDVLHPESIDCCTDRFARLKQGEELIAIQFKFRTQSGETVHLSGDCGSIVRNGEVISTRGIFRNISEKVHAEEALRKSDARYQALYENAPDIYTTIGLNGEILSINQVGARMLGYQRDELIGESAAKVIHPEDQEEVFGYIRRQFAQPFEDQGIEYRTLKQDGSILWVHQRVSLHPENNHPMLLVVCRDITDKRKLQQQLEYQAAHDPLTNLINRREFEHRLKRMLESSSEFAEHHVLCYLDLDRFKAINDNCGHAAGDELLRQVASLLQGHVRSRDTIARLGGDEFAILMEHCQVDVAKSLAEKLRELIESFCFHWRLQQLSIGVSIGVVPVYKGCSVDDAIDLADSACYAAKKQGRNQVHVYEPRDHAFPMQVDSMRWVSNITHAIECRQFRLYAQPIHSCAAKQGGERYEILLRLQDGDQAIQPAAFMPAAERYNLSVKIDHCVFDSLLEWFEHQPQALQRLDSCSVNLSALSLCNDGFLQHVTKKLQHSALPPDKLCFEITETAAIANHGQAVAFIQSLQGIGCSFSLDDFGSGLSSLAYLKDLPVDMVKIDGAFIRNIDKNEIDFAMVKSICEIVHRMGKQATAEYVESAAALQLLNEIGVDYVQGYHLAMPAPLDLMASIPQRGRGKVISLHR